MRNKHFKKLYILDFDFTHICREFVDVAIYALYPESFCMKNPAVRKVFVFFLTLLLPLVKDYKELFEFFQG